LRLLLQLIIVADVVNDAPSGVEDI
jgi:hypothetical protein